MRFLKTKGIVIKEANYDEADKIITILTQKEGKIQASARGSKRPRSRLIAGTQFLCYSDFILYKGKNMYNVNQSEVIENFYSIRESIENLSYATYFSEVALVVADEGYPNNDLLRLLLNTLHLLSTNKKDPRILKIVYELKLMCIIGYTPNLVSCTNCGGNSEKLYFNSKCGGLVCNICILKVESKNNFILNTGTIKAMRHIVYNKTNKIFSFEISDEIIEQLNSIIKDFLLTHITSEFKTAKFLENITKITK